MPRNTIESRVLDRIARKRRDVFLRDDFNDLGGYDQVGRVLLLLVRQGQLMKMGQGVYVRTRPSILDGKPIPAKGIRDLAAQALRRLGFKTAPTRLDEDYSAGRTTQVPTGRSIAVCGRIRRKLNYNGTPLRFERAGPSPR